MAQEVNDAVLLRVNASGPPSEEEIHLRAQLHSNLMTVIEANFTPLEA